MNLYMENDSLYSGLFNIRKILKFYPGCTHFILRNPNGIRSEGYPLVRMDMSSKKLICKINPKFFNANELLLVKYEEGGTDESSNQTIILRSVDMESR